MMCCFFKSGLCLKSLTAPGCQQSSVGPFGEEEEGTCVASDVVKVQCEDPATPGPLP